MDENVPNGGCRSLDFKEQVLLERGRILNPREQLQTAREQAMTAREQDLASSRQGLYLAVNSGPGKE